MEPSTIAAAIPTWDQLARFAPLALLVVGLVAIGAVAGWYARGETVRTLREWLDDVRRK